MKDQTSTAEWYTTAFIVTYLKKYFLNKGFRIVSEEQPIDNHVLLFCKLLSKERVEIKGTLPEPAFSKKQMDPEQHYGMLEIMKYVLDIALSPLSFFSSEEEKCICLPAVKEYEEVVERLRGYFISNNLELKVYFVKEDGTVRFVHLKQNRDQVLSSLQTPDLSC